MKVTKRTSWLKLSYIWKYILEDQKKELKKIAVNALFGASGFWSLTLEQLIDITVNGDFSIFKLGKKAYPYIALLAFKEDFYPTFEKALTNLTPRRTDLDDVAGNASIDYSVSEGFLIFARSYFNLQSFEQAAKVKLGDFIIAKKDYYNKVEGQRAVDKYYQSKH